MGLNFPDTGTRVFICFICQLGHAYSILCPMGNLSIYPFAAAEGTVVAVQVGGMYSSIYYGYICIYMEIGVLYIRCFGV